MSGSHILTLDNAASSLTGRLCREADDVASKLMLVCLAGSRLRSADEMRAAARRLRSAADHIDDNAAAVEARHAG